MGHEFIKIDRAGWVVTVTLDRPGTKNACSMSMWLAIRDSFREIAASNARAVVLTGANGDFCSGADVVTSSGSDQAAKVAADPSFGTADLSSLRPASLDAVLPKELRARPGARANLFGMTETFGPYCGSRLDVDLPESAFGSCGRPFEGIEIRIVDPESGEPAPRGQQGEIAVRGPNVMRGISGRLRESTFTRDGFYRTGDLGVQGAGGYLFYAGRLDDMFKVSGASVYPTEIEAALRTIPGVAQAYVTNLTEPTGELVGAAVVTRAATSVADLDREARARLSSFKVPKRWVMLRSPADVPTMATGKVDKPGLQALLRIAGERAPSAGGLG